ncbi:DNA-binding protein [Paraburkholderia dipogonis]|uniref:DNA-binding protein n=1 Tax=Paraburkholderia dipogonis TaxID=1211383 RepID=A0A4Y8MXJ7_9BURK|nr:helix-turn-helix domain-containing protein [Paraburkholderia dipogonis]TFE42033.1 DNA-binding protein [Paraburkholderia dipogonis]
MSLYIHPPGEGPGVVYLEHWSIREFENGKRFFVGFSRESQDGRVSTEIVELDGAARRGRTASGRIYELVGLNGYNSDAEYVFGCVATIIGGGGAWRNVTAELIPDCGVRGSAVTEDLSLEAAAQFLGVSRTFVRSLIDDGKLPSRIDKTGGGRIRRIPTSALRVYREKMRVRQRAGLQQMMEASERAGLYDAEIEDLPKRQRHEGENE